MRQRPVAGFLLSLGLLSFTPLPPLPGFWHLVAMAGSAFLPGVESTTGSAMIPNAVLLSGGSLAVIAVLILSGRIIQWLSIVQHHEPRRGFTATESEPDAGLMPAGSEP
jgi:formate hydrogenlyase subunit 3/multisubunit Na+/H+ antiporter MnhD subunit